MTRVVDGDTLWARVTGAAEDVKLRLLRIDAPEMDGGQGPECLATAARDHLTGLTPPGAGVWLAYDVETQDRFGRDLVHVWTAEQVWVNGAMVRDGFAVVVTFPPNLAFDDEIRSAQEDARDRSRGLWDERRCP